MTNTSRMNCTSSNRNPSQKKRKRESKPVKNGSGSRSEDDVEMSLGGSSDLERKAEKKRLKRLSKEHDKDQGQGSDEKSKRKKEKKEKKKKFKEMESKSAFEMIITNIKVPIPPIMSETPMNAVTELFDTLLLRYVPQLQGILLSHNDHQFVNPTAKIDSDSAFAVCNVRVRCLVWRPRIGMKVEGKISLSEPSQVSLILHNTFNASISASHLPKSQAEESEPEDEDQDQDPETSTSSKKRKSKKKDEQWEFIYEDFSLDNNHSNKNKDGMEIDSNQDSGLTGGGEEEGWANGDQDLSQQRSLGYWRSKKDGRKLGGDDGKVTFTIISLKVSDHQISLQGSLLSNPSSVPLPTPSRNKFYDQSFAIAQKKVGFGPDQVYPITNIHDPDNFKDYTDDESESEREDGFNMQVHLPGKKGGFESESDSDVDGSSFSRVEDESQEEEEETKAMKKKRKEEKKRRREEEKEEKKRKKAKK